jgi:hypothetical protein
VYIQYIALSLQVTKRKIPNQVTLVDRTFLPPIFITADCIQLYVAVVVSLLQNSS